MEIQFLQQSYTKIWLSIQVSFLLQWEKYLEYCSVTDL